MEKIVQLSGRIDTSNVDGIEKELLEQINGFDGELVLDASDLKYISSAGLRMILRLKKLNQNTKVINCSSEVFEIFEMTGFSDMMDISKAYRSISIDGCEVIGEGFYGTVYQTDPETIVKVYKKGSSVEMVKNEVELARKAFVLGIPTAIPYDIVRVGDLYGSVFELLNAKSLQKLIVNGTDIDELAKKSVNVLKIIHNTKLSENELPNKKEFEINLVKDCSDYLPQETMDNLIHLIENVPDPNTMIHGDFHIKNMMLQDDEIILIDMDKLSIGHPIFELGAIYATYKAFATIDKNNIKDFLGITNEQSDAYLDATFKYYFDGKDKEYINNIIEKCKIIAYLFVLWLRSRYLENATEIQKQEIEFSKNYLIENVPKIESLEF